MPDVFYCASRAISVTSGELTALCNLHVRSVGVKMMGETLRNRS